MVSRAKRIAPAIPYIAVVAGLLVMSSAWAAILFYHAGIAVTLLARERAVGGVLSGWKPIPCVLGAIVCSCGGIAVYMLWPIVAKPDFPMDRVLAQVGLVGAKWWIFVVYFAAVHPVLEEVFWRDYLLSTNPRPGIVDVSFAGYHVVPLSFFLVPGWIAVAVVVLSLVSWLWRRSAIRWGGLGVPLCTHVVADLSIITAAVVIRMHPS